MAIAILLGFLPSIYIWCFFSHQAWELHKLLHNVTSASEEKNDLVMGEKLGIFCCFVCANHLVNS